MELTVPESVPALAAVAVTSARVESWVGGVRGIADSTPVALGDRFHLGSNAKAMTATVAALAVEEGALAWQDDAAFVLGRSRPKGMTLERLLSHTAGVRPLTDDSELSSLPAGRLELAQLLLDEEPRFEPGSQADYSNGGYAIVAAILEHAFGSSFEDVLRGRLFEPLTLDAGFGWPAGPIGHYCRNGVLVAQTPGDGYALPPGLTPAGDVSATIDSYGRFVQLHLRGLRGAAELIAADSFTRLHTPLVGNFALGWGVQEWEGARTSVHAGSAETFFAVVVLQPERDFAAAAIVNAAGEQAGAAATEVVRALVRERTG